MFKDISVIVSLLFFSFCTTAQPVIHGFSPEVAPIGSLITITGQGFDPIAANNTVYFGHAKATVISARPDSLLAVVPYGAGYLPISVTVSGLTAFSSNPFTLSFTGQHITAADFTDQTLLPATGDQPLGLVSADFDNDGRQDIAFVVKWDSSLVIYRNTSNAGAVSFAPPKEYRLYTPLYDIETGDLDGDGKKDLMVTNNGHNSITVLANSSSPGNIQFTILPVLPVGYNGLGISIKDMDADGQPDIVLANYSHRNVSVLRNTSSIGNISFAQNVAFTTAGPPYNTRLEDVNRDNKPDIITADYNNGTVIIWTNNSVADTVRMNAPIIKAVGSGNIIHIEAADLDRDSVKEIITLHHQNAGYTNVCILKDIDTSASFNFVVNKVYTINPDNNPNHITVADVNGDSLPDLVLSTNNYRILILENNSVPGNISMLEKVPVAVGVLNQQFSNRSFVTDLTNDGQPELVTSFTNFNGNGYVAVLKNGIAGRLCAGGDKTVDAGVANALSWQWQMDSGSGFANINNNANFSGTTTASLGIQATPSAWYGYTVRCRVQTASGIIHTNPYVLRFGNYFTGAVSNAWEEPGNWSCGSVPDINTDVFINAGTVVVNQHTTIRSIVIAAGAGVSLAPGVNMIVTH